ncbi:MAG: hypothetical protein CSB13_01480 [Chloroflexi bacterium]|nr:MAG: hypothetical protein CSB13_01480 [Chloroflexota bacterium]
MMIKHILKKAANFVGISSKRGTTFVSFVTPLTEICKHIPLDTIIEFGPGHSTQIFLQHAPNTKILSFETDIKWYNTYKDKFDPDQVNVIYKKPGWDLKEIYAYGENFSLIFVDGGDRLSALEVAYDLIGDVGLVFLHDAHREEYEPGIHKYPYVYCPERHSCILTRNKALLETLKTAVPPDYSCNCQYCSSPERRAYFSQYIS